MTKGQRRDVKKEKSKKRADPGLVVYVTSSCMKCQLLKEYLAAKGIRFRAKDIADSGAMLELAMLTSGRVSVPVLSWKHGVLVNPDWKEFLALLRKL